MDIVDIANSYWHVALFSFLLSVALIFIAVKIFPKFGLVDNPHKYGFTRAPIPYYGGVAIFLAFLISLLIFVNFDKRAIGLLIGATIIVVVGFFDDKFAIKPWIRLVFQFLASLVLVIFGIGILSIKVPFIGVMVLDYPILMGIPILGALFTVIWVMTIVNAMNFLDGVSGLNSGITCVASFSLFLLSVNPKLHENLAGQSEVATIALILSFVALGFVLFDFPKPKILMGDTGSTFFGFLLATLAVFSGGKVATAVLVLGIPIMDMAWVVLRRIIEGKKFWQGDLKHMHHRLLDLGLSRRKVVLVYYVVAAIFGLTAVTLVDSQQKLFMLIALLVLMVLLALSLILVPKKR